jgi:hypothetical protein
MDLKTMIVTAICATLGLLAPPARGQQNSPASLWPAQFNTAEGQVTLFQPQLANFQNNQMTSRQAASVLLNGQTEPVFGVIWLRHDVQVDPAARTVTVLNVSVARSRFPVSDPALQQALNDAVSQFYSGRTVVLSLDKLQATLAAMDKENAAAAELQTAPPKIVFVDHPAVLVPYDGAPRLTQVPNSNLLRAVNTPFFVVLDPATRSYYLEGGGQWFSASDPLGPFQYTGQVPAGVPAEAMAEGYQDPQQALSPQQAAAVQIVTATDPTELIWTQGPAQMQTIAGTDLLYVANTDADAFLNIDTQQYFVLLSGRWYTAPSFNGPWAFVPPSQLPADFAKIPPNSPKADVLASVPGTQAARQAVADAYIPQTAAVDLSQYDQPPVTYDGAPDFQAIAGTDMSYAVNTDSSVIVVGGAYYCCYNAAWYQSGNPLGPWQICTAVPADIYSIPPSCPIYPVRFVYIYGRSGNAIYFGYLPGYLGTYVYDGVVVYGTGYDYQPWIGGVYFSRPCTYGFGAHYDWYTRGWGFNFAVSLGGGGGWIGVRSADHGRRDQWFGHGGFHRVYARDAAHVAAARAQWTQDRARRGVMMGNIYERRADVHYDLPRGGPGPRELSRPAPIERRPAEVGRPQAPPEKLRPLPRETAGRGERGSEQTGAAADQSKRGQFDRGSNPGASNDRGRQEQSDQAARQERQRQQEAAPEQRRDQSQRQDQAQRQDQSRRQEPQPQEQQRQDQQRQDQQRQEQQRQEQQRQDQQRQQPQRQQPDRGSPQQDRGSSQQQNQQQGQDQGSSRQR